MARGLPRGPRPPEPRGDRADSGLRLVVQSRAGPRVEISASTGVDLPGKSPTRSATKWHRGVFDTQRADDVTDVIRELADGRELPAAGDRLDRHRAAGRPAGRRIPSPPVRATPRSVLAFDGAHPPSSGQELESRSSSGQGLQRQLFTDPRVVTDLLQSYYREQGYLGAQDRSAALPYTRGRGPKWWCRCGRGSSFVVRKVTVPPIRVFKPRRAARPAAAHPGQPFLPASPAEPSHGSGSSTGARLQRRPRQITRVRRTAAPAGSRWPSQSTKGRQTVVADVRIAGNRRPVIRW